MTDWTARELEISLNFLKSGHYTAETWSDSAETELDPNRLDHNSRAVSPQDKFKVKLASGGGVVMHFRPVKPR